MSGPYVLAKRLEDPEPDMDGHCAFFMLGENATSVDTKAVHAWLTAEFGERAERILFSRWWMGTGGAVWLADLNDATLFRLRWC